MDNQNNQNDQNEIEKIAVFEVTPMWAGTLSIVDTDAALVAAGVPPERLPKKPARSVAMRRAIEEVAPRGAKIDMLPKGLGVTMSLKDASRLDLEQLAAIQGGTVREAASYLATFTAKVNVQNINGTEIETVSFSPEDHPMVPLVREVYGVKKEQYQCSEDLSVWFSQNILPSLNAISKRSRGGVYYVPASGAGLLKAVQNGLRQVSQSHQIDRNVEGKSFPVHIVSNGGKVYIEPRYKSDSTAMEIAVDGIIRHADGVLNDMEAALQGTDRKLGKRALATKNEEALALEAEISQWEGMASVSLDLLRNRLNELKNAIGMAELAADRNNNQET